MAARNLAKICGRVAALALVLAVTSQIGVAQDRNFPGFPGRPGAAAPPPNASPVPQSAQPQQARNPACVRLEGQLASLENGGANPGQAQQAQRYEDAANRQQSELDKVVAQSRRLGCEGGGFFSLFNSQNPQCAPLNTQIQQMRGNLDQILTQLQHLKGDDSDVQAQRRSVLVALAQNDCGAQYRTAVTRASPGGFFDALLGPGQVFTPSAPSQSSTYRTLCVRTCDGYYFPISYTASPNRFGDDAQECQRECPAAEVELYSHRNPGEDINQAVSQAGQPYTAMPNAFLYRKKYVAACSCRRPGESWADALKSGGDDQTIERGDIVVTKDKAKELSQPQPAKGAPPPKSGPAQADPAKSADSATADKDRKVRSVGPVFLPARTPDGR